MYKEAATFYSNGVQGNTQKALKSQIVSETIKEMLLLSKLSIESDIDGTTNI